MSYRLSMWKIFGLNPEKTAVGWRKFLYDLYYPPNIICVIDSRRMNWAQHVVRMGQKINAYRFGGSLKETVCLEDLARMRG